MGCLQRRHQSISGVYNSAIHRGCHLLLLVGFLTAGAISAGDTKLCFPCPTNCLCAESIAGQCDVNCTSQDLTKIPYFVDLAYKDYIYRLDLRDNQITTLLPYAFAELPNLRELYLSGNPWECTCSLSWLPGWLKTQEQLGLLLTDRHLLLCSEPPVLNKLQVSVAAETHSMCDIGMYASCIFSHQVDSSEIIYLERSLHKPITEANCTHFCWDGHQEYGVYYNTFQPVCLCGSIVTQNCTCPNLDTVLQSIDGSPFCNKLYLRDSFKVDSGLNLRHPIRPYSTLEDISFSASTGYYAIDALNWRFGDGAEIVLPVGYDVKHSYRLRGNYKLHLIPEDHPDNTLQVPLIVEDPVKVVNAPGNIFREISEPFNFNLNLQQGSNVGVTWELIDQAGNKMLGKYCSPGWYPYGAKCLQTSTQTTSGIIAAVQSCRNDDASLLTLLDVYEIDRVLESLALGSKSCFINFVESNDDDDDDDDDQESSTTCMSLSKQGLTNIDCDTSQYFICEKDADVCKYGGVVEMNTGQCYIAMTTPKTWDAAEDTCAQYGGHLVTIQNQEQQNILSDVVLSTESMGPFWIGLNDKDAESNFIWLDGWSLDSFTLWAPSEPDNIPVPADCVQMTVTENIVQWKTENCDQNASFVCQYPFGDMVSQVQTYLNGIASFPAENPEDTTVNLPHATGSSSKTTKALFLFPGLWFSHSGSLQAWYFQSSDIESEIELHLQLYRPSCSPESYFIPAGCNNYPSPYDICAPSPAPCKPHVEEVCELGRQYCPLSTSCLKVGAPCNCKAFPNVLACIDSTPSSTEVLPSYTLVDETIVIVPQETAPNYRIVESNFNIQAYDIIGFEFDSQFTPIKCTNYPSSNASQNVLFLSGKDWHRTGVLYSNFENSYWMEHAVCYIQALYTSPINIQPPHNIQTVNGPAIYTFQTRVQNSISIFEHAVTVNVLKPIFNFTILLPVLQNGDNVSQASLGLAIFEANQLQSFVLRISEGTNVTGFSSWSDGKPLIFDRCSSLTTDITCSVNDSYQYAVYKHVFTANDTHTESQRLEFIAENKVSSASLVVNIQAEEKCKGLTIEAQFPLHVIQRVEYYTARLTAGSHVTFKWEISDDTRIETRNTSISHIFINPGLYTITVRADNDISGQATSIQLTVYQPSLLSEPTVDTLAIVLRGQEVILSFSYRLRNMSYISYTVDFQDSTSPYYHEYIHSMGTDNVTDVIKHSYYVTGTFNVELTIIDRVDQNVTQLVQTVCVVDPVRDVLLSATQNTVATNVLTNITVTHQGTGTFYYDWLFNYMTPGVSSVTSTLSHGFTQPGLYELWVNISNNVSFASSSMDFVVQTPVTQLSLTYNEPAMLDKEVSITALTATGTNISYSLNDLLYIHQDNSFTRTYSSKGTYNVSVTASNKVSAMTEWILIYVIDKSDFVINTITPENVEVNVSVYFTSDVVLSTSAKLEYQWIFGDGEAEKGKDAIGVSHTYQNTGVFNLTLVVKTGKAKATKVKQIYVQEKIGLVTLPGVEPVGLLQGGSVQVIMSVLISNGSDVRYLWKHLGNEETTQSKHATLVFDHTGVFNVFVLAYNRISSANASTEIMVYEIINDIHIILSGNFSYYLATNYTYAFSLIANQGTNLSCIWTFEESQTFFGLNTDYMFFTPGLKTISANVMNPVSAKSVSREVYCEEPIVVKDLFPSSIMIRRGEFRYFITQLLKGTNVQFKWMLCSTIECQNLSTHTGVQNYTFTDHGRFDISVILYNNISSVSVNWTVIVVEEIEGLNISVLGLRNGMYVNQDKDILFSPVVKTGTDITYRWMLTSVRGRVLYNDTSHVLLYRFDLPENYTLILEAFNIAGSQKHTLLFCVEQMVEGPTIHISPLIALVNEKVVLRAAIESGSNPTYTWQITNHTKDLGISRDENSDVILSWSYPGMYEIMLTISNQISEASITKFVRVEEKLETLELTSNTTPPVVPTQTPLAFFANPNNYNGVNYTWTFTDTFPPIFRGTANKTHIFKTPGDYTIIANVSNHVSAVSAHINIVAQEAVITATIVPRLTNLRIGEKVTFKVKLVHGSHLTYMWQIQNDTISTVNNEIEWLFKTSGPHIVSVIVANSISSTTDELTIHVQEEITFLTINGCCDDVIVTKTNLPMRAEIETGTNPSYTWSIYLNGEHIKEDKGAEITYRFLLPGDYEIELTASNAISEVIVSKYARVETKINLVKIKSDIALVSVREGQTVTFSTHITDGSHIHYQWELLEDNAVIDVSTSENYVKLFTKVNVNYIVTVLTYNNISNATSQTNEFRIKERRCQQPILTAVGGLQRKELKSHSIEMEVKVDACLINKVIHQWTIYVNNCTNMEEDKVRLPNNINTNSPLLFLPRWTLDYGIYCVHFFCVYDNSTVSNYLEFELTIAATKLQAIIEGGNECTLAENQDIVLDGTASYDPDGTTTNLAYEWRCRATAVDFRQSGEGNCFSVYNESVKMIDAYTFSPDFTYFITLNVSAAHRRWDIATQRILILYEIMPVVSIDCVSCREKNVFSVSSSQHLKMLGSCSNCRPGDAIYKWAVLKMGTPPNYLELNSETTTTGDDKHNLVIRQGALQDDFTYIFSLNVTSKSLKTTGMSRLVLRPATPPSDGNCSFCVIKSALKTDHLLLDNIQLLPCAMSDSVVALEDIIRVECEDWQDNSGSDSVLLYHVFVERANVTTSQQEWYSIYRGTQSSTTFYLSPFEYTSGGVHVMVEVIDKLDVHTTGFSQYLMVVSPELEEKTRTEYLLNEMENYLPMVMNQGNPKILFQYIIALSLQLNTATIEQGPSDQAQNRSDMRKELLQIINNTAIFSSVDDIVQIAFTLQVLTTHATEFPQKDSKYGIVIDMFNQIIHILYPQVSPGWEADDFVPDYVLTTIGNLIEIIHADISSNVNVNFRTLDQKYKILENAVVVANRMLYLALKTQVTEEDPYLLDTGYLYSQGQRVSTSEPGDQRYESKDKDCYVKLPEVMMDGSLNEIIQIVIFMLTNPFNWGFNDDSHVVTSQTVSVTFQESNGTIIPVEDLPNDGGLNTGLAPEMKFSSKDYMRKVIHKVHKRSVQIPIKKTDIEISFLMLRPREIQSTALNTTGNLATASFHIKFQGEILTHGSVGGDTVILSGYLGYNYIPTSSTYDKVIRITADGLASDDPTHNTLFLEKGSVHSGVDYHLSVANEHGDYPVNVSITIFAAICQFYNENERAWDSYGCAPAHDSTLELTHCQCNHFTLFGASILTPSPDLKFESLWPHYTSTLLIVTLCITGLIYILLLVLGRRWDLMDLRRIGIVPLCGKDGPYKYEITVVTGRRTGAGTSANVGITLFGNYANSKARHLSKSDAFQRGTQDVFLIATEIDLGDIWKICIWHDNTGLEADWYLSRVIIRDLRTRKRHYFIANEWLSVCEEEGTVEKDIFVADSKDLGQFKTLFMAELSRGFSDRHIWVSIFDKPDRNWFTRVQRSHVAFFMLFSCMAINALYFWFVQLSLGYIKTPGMVVIYWEDVVIGIVASLCLFPFGIGLAQILRKSRHKPNPLNLSKRPPSAQTVVMDAEIDGSSTGSFANRSNQRQRTNIFLVDGGEEIQPSRRNGTLRRTGTTMKNINSICLDDIRSEVSDNASVGTRDSTEKGPPLSKSSGNEWSVFDMILNWPERTPAWEADGESSRENSASSTRHSPTGKPPIYPVTREDAIRKSAKPKERGSLSKKPSRRRISVADSTSELQDVSNEDYWSTTYPFSRSRTTEHISLNEYSKRETSFDRQSRASRDESISTEGTTDKPKPITNEKRPRAASITSNVSNETVGSSIIMALEREREGTTVSACNGLAPGYLHTRDRAWTDSSGFTMSSFQTDPFLDLQGNKTKNCMLPYWCSHVATAMCLSFSVVAIVISMVYGIEFDKEFELRWFVACIISLSMSFFILEPLLVVTVAFFSALVNKSISDDVDTDELQPRVESNETIKETKIRRLGGYALLQAKEEGRKVKRMRVMLRQFIVYIIFLILIFSVNYATYTYNNYLVNSHVNSTFVAKTFDNNTRYHDISNDTQYWEWLTTVAAPGIHLNQLNNLSTSGYLLGVARLRQIRSNEVECHTLDQFTNMASPDVLPDTCYGNPGWSEDRQSYGYGWEELIWNNESWNYQDSKITESDSYYGHVHKYGGGGYVQNLDRTYNETLIIIQQLKNRRWIDRGTRAIILEFTLYTANVGIYTVATFATEFPLSGSVITNEQVHAIQLHRITGGGIPITLILECLMFLVFVYFLVHTIMQIYHERLLYFTSLWNWIELSITCLIVSGICVYITLVVNDNHTMNAYLSKKEAYTSFSQCAYWNNIWRWLNAIVLFLVMLLIARQLRFIKCFSVFGRTLQAATGKLLGCLLIFTIIVLTYAQLGYLWFGYMVYAFSNYSLAVLSMVGIIRGKLDFLNDMYRLDEAFTAFFVTSYITLMFLAVLGLVIAVLIDSYKIVRAQTRYYNNIETQDYEMIDFMLKRLKLWIGLTKPKPAFRRVKFQGLPSISSHSASTWRTTSHASSDSSDSLDLEEVYTEELLDRAVPTWEKMCQKLDALEALDKQEQELESKLQTKAVQMMVRRDHLDAVVRNRSGNFSRSTQSLFEAYPRHPWLEERSLSASALMSKTPLAPGATVYTDHSRWTQQRPYSEQGPRSTNNATPMKPVVIDAW